MMLPDFDGKTAGGIAAAITIAALSFRKWLSRDIVERAGDTATVQTIERLQALLETERAARRQAEDRADKFADERNHLIEQLGAMRGQIEALTGKVASLEHIISSLKGVAA